MESTNPKDVSNRKGRKTSKRPPRSKSTSAAAAADDGRVAPSTLTRSISSAPNDDDGRVGAIFEFSPNSGSDPQITWTRGMGHNANGTPNITWERGSTSKSTSVLPTFPSSTIMPDNSSSSCSNSALPKFFYSTMPDTSSSSSTNQRGLGHSFVSRQSIISESDGSVDHILDDDFILGVATSSSPSPHQAADSGTDNPKSIWKSRIHQQGIVDQQVNLMDAETGRYEKNPTRGRGGLGFRQKSLVDIFLQDDSSSSENLRTSLRASRLNRSLEYSLAEKRHGRGRVIERCLMFVFLFLLLVGAVILALPSAFGRTNSSVGNTNASPVTSYNPSLAGVSSDELTKQEDAQEQEPLVDSGEEADNPNTELGIENVAPPIRGDEIDVDVAIIPNDSRNSAMQFLAIDLDISKAESFEDTDSAPSKALKWISEKDAAHLPIPGVDPVNHEDLPRVGRDLLQRYSMAVFYFSQQLHGSPREEEGTRRLVKATAEELNRHQQFHQQWTSKDPVCDWPGVQCDFNHRVTAINVSHSLLGGTLPREIMLGSAFPAMTTLDASHNRLEGILPHLYESNPVTKQSMLLSDNALESLLLQHNMMEGNIDPIVTLKRLTNLDLSNNEFTGRIPVQLGVKLQKLETVNLAMNNLHGKLPSQLSSLTQLTHLDLEGNLFTGTIPSALANMQYMKYLRLQKTNLEGSIPSFLGTLTQLEELCLHNTDLAGKMPDNVCSLVSASGLQVLTSDCNGLLGKVTCDCCTDCFWK